MRAGRTSTSRPPWSSTLVVACRARRPRTAVHSTMPCAALFLVLDSLRLAAVIGPAEKRAVPVPTGTLVVQHGLDGRNLSLREWCDGLTCSDGPHRIPTCALRIQEWRSFEECVGSDEAGGIEELSPRFLLFALLSIMVLATGVVHEFMEHDAFDEPAEDAGDTWNAPPQAHAEGYSEDGDGDTAFEPVSRRVDMTSCLHNPNRPMDLDALAGQTTASALLQHERDATRPVSEGGGRCISLPHKVHLATRWELGAQRLWRRLQPHMASDTWILCTTETFTLFIRRSACPALMNQLPALGEFVGPAIGHQAGRVVFAKRARGAIALATLLAALREAAIQAMNERLEEVVFVTFGDRLPFANYPLDELGVSPEAPLGLSGARLLNYFGQHPDRSTGLFFADVAVHDTLGTDAAGNVVWALYSKRSREERRWREAVVDLGASEMDQYDQHGMSAGWLKVKVNPGKRHELAEDAIDAHTVATRSLLRDSRLAGSGVWWDAPVIHLRQTISTPASTFFAHCRL